MDVYYENIDRNGIPRASWLRADVEIHNTGEEAGNLVWEVDWKKSNLPDLFIHEFSDGSFNDLEYESRIEPRFGFGTFWRMPIELMTANYGPEDFAKWLKNAKGYKVILRYKTRRVGEDSKWKKLVIKGNYSSYRSKLIQMWKKYDHTNLVKLVEGKN